MAFVRDLLSTVQSSNDLDGLLEIFQSRRPFPHDTARTVAATDSTVHSAAGDTIQRRKQAGGDCGIPYDGVRDTCTETHSPRICGHKRQQRILIPPYNVRVEYTIAREIVARVA